MSTVEQNSPQAVINWQSIGKNLEMANLALRTMEIELGLTRAEVVGVLESRPSNAEELEIQKRLLEAREQASRLVLDSMERFREMFRESVEENNGLAQGTLRRKIPGLSKLLLDAYNLGLDVDGQQQKFEKMREEFRTKYGNGNGATRRRSSRDFHTKSV